MKILHVYKDYYPPVQGGIERTVNRMATSQARAGHEVTVLCSARERRTREDHVDGVRVIRAAEWGRLLSAPFCPTMPGLLAGLSPDLSHLHYPNPTGEVSWLIARPPGALVVEYHADIVRQRIALPFYRPVVRAILRRADLVLGHSQRHLDSSGFLHPFRERWRLIPNGIDLERFADLGSRAAEIEALRSRWGAPAILFIGQLRYYKGLDVMLRAMKDVDARLVIIGEGGERGRLEAIRADLGLGDRVEFAGRVSDADLPAWIAAADIGVLPSSSTAEAWGLAMIEMMACGVPMVCTELGTGTSWVNADGESGLVVPPRDPAALAAAVNRLLGDDALRKRLGEGARRRAWSLFSREVMVNEVERVYAEALELHRRKLN